MSTPADEHHVGHGFVQLRQRFVRRALVLATNREFMEAVKNERAAWNDLYPRYLCGPGHQVAASGLPSALDSEWHANRQDYQLHVEGAAGSGRRFANTAGDDRTRAIKEFQGHMRARVRLSEATESVAYEQWEAMIARVAEEHFPTQDFPNLVSILHPATGFVLACISKDSRTLIDTCERYFSDLEAGLSAFPFRHPSVPDGVGPDGVLLWVPLYPGVTANDLKLAAADLVRRANEAYTDRLPRARIHALRDSGLTQRAIADRLGLTEQTVSAALKPRRT